MVDGNRQTIKNPPASETRAGISGGLKYWIVKLYLEYWKSMRTEASQVKAYLPNLVPTDTTEYQAKREASGWRVLIRAVMFADVMGYKKVVLLFSLRRKPLPAGFSVHLKLKYHCLLSLFKVKKSFIFTLVPKLQLHETGSWSFPH